MKKLIQNFGIKNNSSILTIDVIERTTEKRIKKETFYKSHIN